MVYTNCQFPVFFYIIYMYVKSFLDQLFISTSTLIHACLYRYRDKNTWTHIESWFLNCQFPWFFVHVNSYFNHHFVTQFKRVNLQKICMRKASSSGYVFYKMKKSIITTYPVQKCFKKHQAYMIVLSLDMALCISLMCIEKKCTQMPLAQCITHTLFKITLYNIIQHFIALSHNIICIL